MKKLLFLPILFGFLGPVQADVDFDDPLIRHALDVIYQEDRVRASVKSKSKDLLKFGRNTAVGVSTHTIMTLAGSEISETYISSNIITQVVSANTADTQSIVIEGHIDDDNDTDSTDDFTFVTQNAVLTGTNAVTLGTALTRATRLYNNGSVNFVGPVYVFQQGVGTADGVPETDAAVHLIVDTNHNQSEKAATALSKVDYMIITQICIEVLEKTAAFAVAELAIRQSGKVFRTIDYVAATSDSGTRCKRFIPYKIAKPNSDILLQASADGAGTDVSGSFEGYLAIKN